MAQVTVQEAPQEVKEIHIHVKVQKVPQEDVPYHTPLYIATIDVDGAKREMTVSPFKEVNLYFAFSDLTGALHDVYRVAVSKHEKPKTEDFNRALEDIEDALAYLLAYTISEDLK